MGGRATGQASPSSCYAKRFARFRADVKPFSLLDGRSSTLGARRKASPSPSPIPAQPGTLLTQTNMPLAPGLNRPGAPRVTRPSGPSTTNFLHPRKPNPPLRDSPPSVEPPPSLSRPNSSDYPKANTMLCPAPHVTWPACYDQSPNAFASVVNSHRLQFTANQ